METLTFTVRNHDGTIKKVVDNVPLDMELSAFREAAQDALGIPANQTCHLILDKNQQRLNETGTIRSAGLQNNEKLTLVPEFQGGAK